jgi:beta-phosphoglucomutase
LTPQVHFGVEKIANELHIDFTLEHNELLKGVSRVRSLDIILEIGRGHKKNKKQMVVQKNEEQFKWIWIKANYCLAFINAALLKRKPTDSFGISHEPILEKTRIRHYFDAIVDGNDVIMQNQIQKYS